MIRAIGIGVITVLFLSGCQSGPFAKNKNEDPLFVGNGVSPASLEAPGLAASLDTRFPDVPLPVGTREDMERSFVYESQSLQIGRMVYASKDSANAISQFYIQESSKFGWMLQSVLQADGTMISFEKPGKRMWVFVKATGTIRDGSEFIINLVPDDGSGPIRSGSLR